MAAAAGHGSIGRRRQGCCKAAAWTCLTLDGSEVMAAAGGDSSEGYMTYTAPAKAAACTGCDVRGSGTCMHRLRQFKWHHRKISCGIPFLRNSCHPFFQTGPKRISRIAGYYRRSLLFHFAPSHFIYFLGSSLGTVYTWMYRTEQYNNRNTVHSSAA